MEWVFLQRSLIFISLPPETEKVNSALGVFNRVTMLTPWVVSLFITELQEFLLSFKYKSCVWCVCVCVDVYMGLPKNVYTF